MVMRLKAKHYTEPKQKYSKLNLDLKVSMLENMSCCDTIFSKGYMHNQKSAAFIVEHNIIWTQ